MGDWTVVTLVGSSLLNRLSSHAAASQGIVEGAPSHPELKELQRWLRSYPPENLEHLSAELRSAAVIARSPEFRGGRVRLQLIAPKTDEALLAARILSGFGEWKFLQSVVEFRFDPEKDCVPGLQMSDRRDFVYQGLPVLLRRLSEIVEMSPVPVVVNCTSGVRAVVPYLSAFAMIYGLRVVYVFEKSNALLTIPSVPLTPDWGMVEWYLPALEALQNGIEQPVSVVVETTYYRHEVSRCVLDPHRIPEISRILRVGFISYHEASRLFGGKVVGNRRCIWATSGQQRFGVLSRRGLSLVSRVSTSTDVPMIDSSTRQGNRDNLPVAFNW
ncbi:MAG: hypothetical protein K6T83_07955 [Alicyclobacillus sp.]|nr:hypothetical protein [Alicyclobacillus sp.]